TCSHLCTQSFISPSSYLLSLNLARLPRSHLFPYTTLFRSHTHYYPPTGTPSPAPSASSDAGMPSRPTLHARQRTRRWSDHDADRSESTRLNSSHVKISYAVFCLKKKNNITFY